ncbi:MAG: hypothetical protein JHC26_01145 [Thermofilum sp.]|jgi:hypothetical protein|uniref:hypothetical protein n=1 Tax=Thermofilum sp. TaxID=1961369 RepID=UPI002589731F|nr:hypothetical protein [Thermofilum sp.]MCI4407665.1 hypothetical protein [Thermofilum sp.]
MTTYNEKGVHHSLKHEPPRGVKILSIIYSLVGALLILGGIFGIFTGTCVACALMPIIGTGVVYVGRGLVKGKKWAAWSATILALFQPLEPVYWIIAYYLLLSPVREYFNIHIRSKLQGVLYTLLVYFLIPILILSLLIIGAGALFIYEKFLKFLFPP